MADKLGDGPIDVELRDLMNALARGIDDALNGEAARTTARKNGFVLLVFPFEGHEGRCNYISNGAAREDIVTLMKEQIKRFEGQPDVTGRA